MCNSPGCGANVKWSGLCGEHYWEMCAKAADPNVLGSLIEEAEKVCDMRPMDARFDKLRLMLQPFLLMREAQCREATRGLDELCEKLQAKTNLDSVLGKLEDKPIADVQFTTEELAAFHDDEE